MTDLIARTSLRFQNGMDHDSCVETVSMPGNSLNEGIRFGAEGLPQHGDLEGETAILDVHSRPKGREYFRLGHCPVAILDEKLKQVESLRRESNRCIFLKQSTRSGLEPEGAELVDAARFNHSVRFLSNTPDREGAHAQGSSCSRANASISPDYTP